MTARKVGLLGGAFDPIHNGHLGIAQDALAQLPLDQIRLIPTAQPPHKAASSASFQQRCQMAELAVAEHPKIIVDACEGQRAGPSYSVDTLAHFEQQHPGNEWFWLMGSDAFAQIHRWHQWERCLEFAHFVVFTRPDSAPLNTSTDSSAKPLLPKTARITQLTINPQAISSTVIRQRVATQLPIQGVMPEPVADYIEKHQLYAD